MWVTFASKWVKENFDEWKTGFEKLAVCDVLASRSVSSESKLLLRWVNKTSMNDMHRTHWPLCSRIRKPEALYPRSSWFSVSAFSKSLPLDHRVCRRWWMQCLLHRSIPRQSNSSGKLESFHCCSDYNLSRHNTMGLTKNRYWIESFCTRQFYIRPKVQTTLPYGPIRLRLKWYWAPPHDKMDLYTIEPANCYIFSHGLLIEGASPIEYSQIRLKRPKKEFSDEIRSNYNRISGHNRMHRIQR